jgi:hypothetical protein
MLWIRFIMNGVRMYPMCASEDASCTSVTTNSRPAEPFDVVTLRPSLTTASGIFLPEKVVKPSRSLQPRAKLKSSHRDLHKLMVIYRSLGAKSRLTHSRDSPSLCSVLFCFLSLAVFVDNNPNNITQKALKGCLEASFRGGWGRGGWWLAPQ